MSYLENSLFDIDDTDTHNAPNMLDPLNPEQREAVEHTEGPLLVLAGAGTGKTRVLTTRIASILANNLAFPSQILAVTFTNKAAKEMQHRLEDMVGEQATGLWLGTFHSICVRLLRRHAELVGLKPDFTIIDTDDQVRLIKRLMEDANIDEKRFPAKAIATIIQRTKDRAITPDKAQNEEIAHIGDGKLLSLYERYQARLRSLSVVDFGDLLLHCITLFTNNADILAEYQRRFRYILVDEYQDTNIAQYLWLRLLASSHKNICCVGDDDQSIYGWRGAEVGNILKFEQDYEGAKTIRLECNYRSTPEILATASSVIANNKSRLGKTLWTEQSSGEKVQVVSVWDDKMEAQYIGTEIESCQQSKRHALSDMAILVRASHQTRAFEECFIAMSIPYKVIGGLRFYERMEIRDAIAYIRTMVQPDNDLALERIINTPKRGIGDSTLTHIRDYAQTHNISLMRAIEQLLSQQGFTPRIEASLRPFYDGFIRWKAALENTPHSEVVGTMLEESGYLSIWEKQKTPEAEGRLENLKELLTALEEFETLEAFLEHVSLVMETDQIDQSNMVSIMTMHGAKGLEFNKVFLAGWEEGIFPSQRSLDESGSKALEEERRLAYVGITRAKKELTISFASNRRIFQQWQSSIPSRFIDELPKEHIALINAQGPSYTPQERKQTQAYYRKSSNNNSTSQSSSGFSKGARIFHEKFGYGRIVRIQGKHLHIAFEKAGNKTVLEEFVKKA